ncbi:M1 family metallopeptidase [Sphingomonas sp. LB-2]|uniref:M1 family metallopeptidase n=1 Tax=Sphingomonas caeni TaxID=2984949 RepID=UPI002230B434|nr:M1 family metallopeptidase [Sphingomonas caeni]MCW3848787.1 M1 family metallopeptidase [Sphingomonas caeni]
MRALILAFVALLIPASALAADPTGKLPDQVTPITYRLDLTVVPEQARFSGHTEIDIRLKRPSAFIYMHGRDLHVTRAVAKIGGREFPVIFSQISPLGLAKLDFGRSVPAGKMTLKFDYDAAFGSGPSGLYRIKVGGEYYSWSQFESIDARAAFPSFDEPGYKTPFTVTLTTKPGFVAASNGPEIGKGTPKGDLVTHRFLATKPMPTYLIAFVVGPFKTLETVVPPTPQRKWPLPLRVIATKPNADQMQYALDQSGKIVALLEAYFGQAFPYPKLDQVGSPVMPGAMENAGIDIYGDSILFLSESDQTTRKQAFGMIVAHELSHQWFGDLVTPAWWDDIWLNESFANWMGYRIGNEWRPDLNIGVDAIDEAFDAANLDALTVGRPIHEVITQDSQIDGAFDQITYGKGGQVVAMVADYMGDTLFRDGVRLHMRRHIYGNASTDDFFGALADAAKDPRVLASLRSFVDQPGIPLVTLHRDGDRLVATQTRFAYYGANPKPQQWIIPFCLRREKTRSCTLIDQPNEAVSAAGGGVIVPNAGGWGYYRYDLDDADWKALIAGSASLGAGEALAMNDSLWANFYAGRGNFNRLVAAAAVMAGNKDSNAAVDNGQRLAGMIRRGLVSKEAEPAFRTMLSHIYAPVLAKLGFDPREGAYVSDDPDRQKLRNSLVELLANDARDPQLAATLTAAAEKYLGGDTKALDSQFMSAGFAALMRAKGLDYAKTLVTNALSGDDEALADSMYDAIGDVGDPAIATWFVKEFKHPKLNFGQRIGTMISLLSDPQVSAVVLPEVLNAFDALSRSRGGIFAARAAGSFGTLCVAAQADTVEARLKPALIAGHTSTLSLDRAMEQIRNCAAFREKFAGDVSGTILAAK